MVFESPLKVSNGGTDIRSKKIIENILDTISKSRCGSLSISSSVFTLLHAGSKSSQLPALPPLEARRAR